MKRQLGRTCIGVSLVALLCANSARAADDPQSPQAATAPQPQAQAAEGPYQIDEIVVTARRKFESLEDVPLSVQALTVDTIEKYNVTNLSDVQKIVPGLTMSQNINGYGAAATMRGVDFDVVASANNATVEFYLNDAPISSTIIFASLYDVAQVEVLRGPQGTLRGRASPSGSITIATHKPDLSEFGGYANLTVNTEGGFNRQGALNVPIIPDKLAVRVAAAYDDNDANSVTSLDNSAKPKSRTKSGRISIAAAPTDFLELDATYERLWSHAIDFQQVESFSQSSSTAAASPVLITAADRKSIYDAPFDVTQDNNIFTWQATAHALDQTLTYVGSWMQQNLYNFENGDSANFFDGKNVLGVNSAPVSDLTFGQRVHAQQKNASHEVRLQNEERLFGMFDYVAGFFTRTSRTPNDVARDTPLVLGYYPIAGSPYFANVGSMVHTTEVASRDRTEETSFYGNLTAYLWDNTELAGGARLIQYKDVSSLAVDGTQIPYATRDADYTHAIFNASLKQRFDENLMGYLSVGTSWRPGAFVVGDFNLAASPLEQSFISLKPETSTSYEAGLKSEWFDKKVTLNLAAYLQDFDNYPYRVGGNGVYFINTSYVSNALVQNVSQFNFAGAVPVRVYGVEAELAYRPVPNWFLAGTLNYADGRIQNGVVPCNDLNGDGVPDTNLTAAPTLAQLRAVVGANNLSSCKVNYRSSSSSPWSGTLQSEYSQSLGNNVQGFVRGLLSWKGESQNDPTNSYDDLGSYALLDLYFGVRAPDSAWELSLFAKNLTGVEKVLTRSNGQLSTAYQVVNVSNLTSTAAAANGSYTGITTTVPRVFGFSLRYSFGSR
ncbi:TonB-dependent receptor [Nitrospirillum iridis]|uniref:Iron complex outermembrane receptor protein n=1 Tax=Nitrospirillum iridis TaxID=765888 RepID=A0A7X0B028_9PROT|nr:TonB-dependent receptor [Nitrospirillum iridis]MBB6253297.1 iron complex outermembrane receptor protein [Nitrospirillum iridis]